MDDQKKYDFVIYGASGFTGKLVVEYALEKYLDYENMRRSTAYHYQGIIYKDSHLYHNDELRFFSN